jgi:triosephosphate isomerase (TIM)
MPAESRKPLISGNWKMHHNHFEAIQTLQKLAYRLEKDDYEFVDVSVHAPFTDIRSVQTTLESDRIPIIVGAQNCYWEDKGAFTGEVSPAFLAKLNVGLVIVGHSERREIFGETDEWVNKKVKAVLKYDMTPIMCVGETLDEREEGLADEKVLGQLKAGLAGVSAEQVGSMVVAYEPIWAIGTGKTATTDDAQAMCAHIRHAIGDISGSDAGASVRVQYGGSVKGTNIAELMGAPDIDGALVGGASLDPDEFAKIVQYRLHQL